MLFRPVVASCLLITLLVVMSPFLAADKPRMHESEHGEEASQVVYPVGRRGDPPPPPAGTKSVVPHGYLPAAEAALNKRMAADGAAGAVKRIRGLITEYSQTLCDTSKPPDKPIAETAAALARCCELLAPAIQKSIDAEDEAAKALKAAVDEYVTVGQAAAAQQELASRSQAVVNELQRQEYERHNPNDLPPIVKQAAVALTADMYATQIKLALPKVPAGVWFDTGILSTEHPDVINLHPELKEQWERSTHNTWKVRWAEPQQKQ